MSTFSAFSSTTQRDVFLGRAQVNRADSRTLARSPVPPLDPFFAWLDHPACVRAANVIEGIAKRLINERFSDSPTAGVVGAPCYAKACKKTCLRI